MGPSEPARGSPQLPRAGEGRVRSCACALESAGLGTAGGGGRGRANLEPTNDGTGRALVRGATGEGRAQGLKGGVRTLQPGREDGSRARTKWPRRLLHPFPHPGVSLCCLQPLSRHCRRSSRAAQVPHTHASQLPRFGARTGPARPGRRFRPRGAARVTWPGTSLSGAGRAAQPARDPAEPSAHDGSRKSAAPVARGSGSRPLRAPGARACVWTRSDMNGASGFSEPGLLRPSPPSIENRLGFQAEPRFLRPSPARVSYLEKER